jgi:hypothetical protein
VQDAVDAVPCAGAGQDGLEVNVAGLDLESEGEEELHELRHRALVEDLARPVVADAVGGPKLVVQIAQRSGCHLISPFEWSGADGKRAVSML